MNCIWAAAVTAGAEVDEAVPADLTGLVDVADEAMESVGDVEVVVEIDVVDVVNGTVALVAGANSVGGGATVVVVDGAVLCSWNLAKESGVCICRPSSVSHEAIPTPVRTSARITRGRRRMAPERRAHVTDPTGRSMASLTAVEERLTLLSVHAHPDDEASKGAATVAKYHTENVHTVLVCCTGGEEGDLQNASLREPGGPFHGLSAEAERALLAELRPLELAASAALIGYDQVEMLGYRDSGMPDSASNEHPDSFHQADIDEATGRLVAVIRETRPQVVLTYGDDQKFYPHPDHLRVHDVSVLAFDRAGDPDWYPQLGSPFQPSKLYYATWSFERMLAVHKALIAKNGSSPFEDAWFERPNKDERITTRIDIADYQWARSGALRAHATQIDPAEAWWFGLDDDELNSVWPWEEWVLARSLVGPIPAHRTENDLFEGIRNSVASERR
jgi:mycothiol S-conjugate amidase